MSAGLRAAEPAQATEPTLAVTGQGEASAKPDLAVVRVGAAVQASAASDAQAKVNQVVQATLASLKGLGIDAQRISTSGVELSPLYSTPEPRRPGDVPPPPQVTGYQASNVVRVEVTDIQRVGEVIDAAVKAGANRIDGVSFELKDQGEARAKALRDAVADARIKANVMAEAMGLRLESVLEVNEEGVQPFFPQARMRAAVGFAMESGTPIEPGQVRINASVTVRYRIGQGAAK
jgi:uncharacterized protein YggE